MNGQQSRTEQVDVRKRSE